MRIFRIVPLLAVVAVLALTAACGDDDDGGDQADFDPAQVANDAAGALDGQATFHFLLEHNNGATAIVQGLEMTRAEGDIARPASMKANLDAEAAGQTLKVKMVGIDQKVWLTNPFSPDSWQRLPGVAATDVLDLAQVPGVLRAMTDLRADGHETIDGVDCYRVRGTVDSGALAPVIPAVAKPGHVVAVTLWAGVDDGLPRRVVLDGPLNDDEPDDISRTLTLSAFGGPVTIEPPE